MLDLADFHEFCTDLFAAGPPVSSLTNGQLDQFAREGFLAGIPILDENQVGVLRTELDRLMDADHPRRDLWYEFHLDESPHPDERLFHALGAWRLEPGFHDLLWSPSFVGPAEQLLGGPIRFWHDQLFCKPPREGGVVAWHQDYSYWTRTEPMAHLTCWIALDSTTRENGCLQYVPGSHNWSLLPITGLAGDMDGIREVLSDDQWESLQNPVPIELEPGMASFHHPLLVHGSFANHSERPRRGVVLNVVRDGVASASDKPLLEGVPSIPAGQPLTGKFFPLLSQTASTTE